jgi:hypothetical protein
MRIIRLLGCGGGILGCAGGLLYMHFVGLSDKTIGLCLVIGVFGALGLGLQRMGHSAHELYILPLRNLALFSLKRREVDWMLETHKLSRAEHDVILVKLCEKHLLDS